MLRRCMFARLRSAIRISSPYAQQHRAIRQFCAPPVTSALHNDEEHEEDANWDFEDEDYEELHRFEEQLLQKLAEGSSLNRADNVGCSWKDPIALPESVHGRCKS